MAQRQSIIHIVGLTIIVKGRGKILYPARNVSKTHTLQSSTLMGDQETLKKYITTVTALILNNLKASRPFIATAQIFSTG